MYIQEAGCTGIGCFTSSVPGSSWAQHTCTTTGSSELLSLTYYKQWCKKVCFSWCFSSPCYLRAVWITGKFAGQTPCTTFTHALDWKKDEEKITQLCVNMHYDTIAASALLTGMGSWTVGLTRSHYNTCDVIT